MCVYFFLKGYICVLDSYFYATSSQCLRELHLFAALTHDMAL